MSLYYRMLVDGEMYEISCAIPEPDEPGYETQSARLHEYARNTLIPNRFRSITQTEFNIENGNVPDRVWTVDSYGNEIEEVEL